MTYPLIKVTGYAKTTAVAGAIAGVIRDHKGAEVQSIGYESVYLAVKSIIWASEYLANDGITIDIVPQFIVLQLEDREKTAINFRLEQNNAATVEQEGSENPRYASRFSLSKKGKRLDQRFSPAVLTSDIQPIIQAIQDLEDIIDEMQGEQPEELLIKSIRQYTTIGVELVKDSKALKMIRGLPASWKRSSSAKADICMKMIDQHGSALSVGQKQLYFERLLKVISLLYASEYDIKVS